MTPEDAGIAAERFRVSLSNLHIVRRLVGFNLKKQEKLQSS
jgi:hypothetical protein